MSETKLRRGRPKGSGIDDRSRLKQLAALLIENPDLKPTTAIRALGIKDPSAIRRLRDKFHAARGELMEEVQAKAAPAARPTAAPAVRSLASPAQRALAAAPVDMRKSAPAPAPPPAASGPEPPPGRDPLIGLPIGPAPQVPTAAKRSRALPAGDFWMSTWCGLGLQAMTSAVAAQVELTQHMARLPQMKAALRHHLALSELALAIYSSNVAAARL